jgi:hypothetical protein
VDRCQVIEERIQLLEVVEVFRMAAEEAGEGFRAKCREEVRCNKEAVVVLVQAIILTKINIWQYSQIVSLSQNSLPRFKLQRNVLKLSYGYNKGGRTGPQKQGLMRKFNKPKVKLKLGLRTIKNYQEQNCQKLSRN